MITRREITNSGLVYNIDCTTPTISESERLNVYMVPDVIKLEAQWAQPVSLTFHSLLRKLYTESSIGVLPTKFLFIWLIGFREDFIEINQSETRIACL
jgi:hypothetical protein